jgi:hypothetical protein
VATKAKADKGDEQPAGKTVDGYIAGLEGWQQEAATAVRKLVREAAPDAKESIKWSQPVWEVNGPICYIKAFKNHLNFGFWRGAQIEKPAVPLETSGSKMGHVKLTGAGDVRAEDFKSLVRAAVELNRTMGDPTKNP